MPKGSVARRGDAVVIIVDVQEKLAAAMPERERVLSAIGRVAKTAALVGVPIIVTRQYPRGLGGVDPGLDGLVDGVRADGGLVLSADKVTFDCFGEPGFVEALDSTGRRQLVVVGMETHICVTQTALSGLAEEYDVHVVADACCSRQASSHEIALARVREAGAVVTTTESVMYELVGAAATDEFRALLAIVKE